MKRGLLIILIGLALGVAGGFAAYFTRTAPQRAILCSDEPEMAWLKNEFRLTDTQFAAVQKMHEHYMEHCAEFCRRIAATNELIRARISTAGEVTPELQQLFAGAAELRAECQAHMLEHCFAVSREMSPEQGKRYLAWVQDQILVMPHEQPDSESPHAAHGH